MAKSQGARLKPILAILAVLAVAAAIRMALKDKGLDISEEVGLQDLIEGEVKSSTLKSIEISFAGEGKEGEDPPKPLKLSRDGDRWKIDSYHGAPADSEKIADLIEDLDKLSGEIRLGGEKLFESSKLKDKQALHFRGIGDNGEESFHVLLGKDKFARRAEDKEVYTVAVDLRDRLGIYGEDPKAPEQNHFLDKQIVKLEVSMIKKLEMRWPERDLTLEHVQKKGGDEDEYEWKATGGDMGLKLKAAVVDSILDALKDYSAADVVDPNKDRGLGKDAPYRCLVTLEDNSTVEFQGARLEDGSDRVISVSKRPGVVYKLYSYGFERLFKPGKELFELPKPGLKQDDIVSVTTRSDGATRVFRKKDDQWALVEPAIGHKVEQWKTGQVARYVADLKPADVVRGGDAAARGLGPKPARTVEVVMKDKKKHVFKIGNETQDGGGFYAVLDETGERTYVVAKYDLESIFPKLSSLFDASLFPDESLSDVTEASVSGTDKDFALKKKDDAWTLTVAGKEEKGRKLTIDDWLRPILETLKADELKVGVEPPAKLRGTVTLKRGEKPAVTVKVGAFADGRQSAWRSDRKIAFEFGSDVTEKFFPDPALLRMRDTSEAGKDAKTYPGDPIPAGKEPVKTDSGLQYVDLKVGEGDSPSDGDNVQVHYTGWLESDGSKFDSSVDRGEPFPFALGRGKVIKGWDEGVKTMKVGGKRKLIIPAKLGYGDKGFPPDIPGGATLVFDVELLKIEK